MDAKQRMARLQQSLRESPIKLFEGETFRIGWAFFWRQLILMSPAYAFGIWGEMREQRINRIPGPVFVVILAVLVPYVFAALAAAESWRATGRLMPAAGAPVRLLKSGFALWWRIVLGFVPFLGLLYVAAMLLGGAGVDPDAGMIVLGIAWVAFILPVMGRAVRHWQRAVSIEEGAGTAVVTGADA